jgi:hypothetical protein
MAWNLDISGIMAVGLDIKRISDRRLT